MTVEHTSDLQDALQARLSDALQGQGVAEEQGGDAPDIPVYLTVTDDRHRLYVRLEAFHMLQGNSKVGHVDRHSFLVKVIHDRNTSSDVITRGDRQTPRVLGLIKTALKDWSPLENATAPKFLSSFEVEDENPDITVRVCRYETHLTGD